MNYKKPLIGQIGSGWIGGSYAQEFLDRGYEVIQYSLEPEFINNKDKIKDADFVFIAVPTPTTPEGFDYSIVEDVLSLVGEGKIAIIKSTILPGTTRKLQEKYPDISVLHSPEFLREETAMNDVRYPDRNIIGYADEKGEMMADKVLTILPHAPYRVICEAEVAEAIKYMGNFMLYLKVLGANIMYDFCQGAGVDYDLVKMGVVNDPRIGNTHLDINHKNGRGAGGHCFPKDAAALRFMFEDITDNDAMVDALLAMESLNKSLLKGSGKDLDILEGIYGKE